MEPFNAPSASMENKTRPRKGQTVVSTEDGSVLGIVDHVGGYKDNVCYLTNEKSFIWRFSRSFNQLFSWIK